MKKNDGQLVLLGEQFTGRDEMNLARNPFALLSAASRSGQSVLRREWEREIAGRKVQASWVVTGHPELGLPGDFEERVYLVLMQLAEEQRVAGDWSEKVMFSRASLLRRLGSQESARDYKRLSDALARLQTVNIEAKYAFYDRKTGAPMAHVGFSLLDSFALLDDRRRGNTSETLPLSWVKWSSTVTESLEAGYVRGLALDFCLSLGSSVSQRLFRLLEVERCAQTPPRTVFEIEVFTLRDRLGMVSYPYASKVKEKLVSAVEELQDRGYLAEVTFRKDKKVESAIFHWAKVGIGQTMPQALSTPSNSTGNTRKENEEPLFEPSELSDREAIERGAPLWAKLTDEQRAVLLAEARSGIAPFLWDRLDNPESPISERLFRLVLRDFEKLALREETGNPF